MLLLLWVFLHDLGGLDVGVPDEEVVQREEDGDERDADAVGDHRRHPDQLLVRLGLVQLLDEVLEGGDQTLLLTFNTGLYDHSFSRFQ